MTRLQRQWKETALCSTAGAVLIWSMVTADPGLAGFDLWRLVVGAVTLVGPGASAVLLLRIQDRLLAAVAGVGVGMAVLVVAAQVSLYSGHWSPIGVIRLVAALTLVLALSSLARPPGPAVPPAGAPPAVPKEIRRD
jgi:hypothetical protein